MGSLCFRKAGYNLVDKTISQAKVLKDYMRGNCNSEKEMIKEFHKNFRNTRVKMQLQSDSFQQEGGSRQKKKWWGKRSKSRVPLGHLLNMLANLPSVLRKNTEGPPGSGP